MIRKPKVRSIIASTITAKGDAQSIIDALDLAGYDVRPKKEWRQALDRRWQAEHEADYLRRDLDSTQQWGQKGYAEARDLGRRCTFLYETARKHGATVEELARTPE